MMSTERLRATGNTSRQLEDIIAQTQEPWRTQLREAVYDLAADSRVAISERLRRVLAGECEPRTKQSELKEGRSHLPGAARLPPAEGRNGLRRWYCGANAVTEIDANDHRTTSVQGADGAAMVLLSHENEPVR